MHAWASWTRAALVALQHACTICPAGAWKVAVGTAGSNHQHSAFRIIILPLPVSSRPRPRPPAMRACMSSTRRAAIAVWYLGRWVHPAPLLNDSAFTDAALPAPTRPTRRSLRSTYFRGPAARPSRWRATGPSARAARPPATAPTRWWWGPSKCPAARTVGGVPQGASGRKHACTPT